jgi:hypothetical protein
MANRSKSQEDDPQKVGSDSGPRTTDDEPTDGPEAQKRREKMQKQEKAEGDRR